jgi:hypothetical protein
MNSNAGCSETVTTLPQVKKRYHQNLYCIMDLDDFNTVNPSKKDWMSIYHERIGRINSRRNETQKVVSRGLLNATSKNMIALRLLKNMRERISKRVTPVLEPTTNQTCSQRRDDKDNFHLACCGICLRPCLAGITQCSTCYDIFHIVCLGISNEPTLTDFICAPCQDKEPIAVIDAKKVIYDRKSKEKNAAVFISMWSLRKLNRARTRLQNRSSAIITCFFKLVARRQRFQQWRRQQLRTSIFRFKLPSIAIKYQLITLSLMDSFKRTQIYRIDRYKTDGIFTGVDSFVIPGLTGEMTIVLTLSIECIISGMNMYVPLLQATIPLKDIRQYLQPIINCEVNFIDKVSWNIPSCKSDYIVLSSIYQPEFSKNDLLSIKSAYKKNNLPVNLVELRRRFLLHLENIKAQPTSCTIFVCIYPLFDAFCGPVQAPTVEVLLQRVIPNPRMSSRSRMYWAILLGTTLTLYDSYGSPYPLICCDLRDSLMTHALNNQTKKKSQSVIVNFPRAEIEWILTFLACSDASRFVNVFSERKSQVKTFRALGVDYSSMNRQCGFGNQTITYS